MTKKEKFLKELDECLDNFGFFNKSFILEKYDKLIDDKLKSKINISKIIDQLDSPEEIAYDEIEKYNKKEKYTDLFNILKIKANDLKEKALKMLIKFKKKSIKKTKKIDKKIKTKERSFNKFFKSKNTKLKNTHKFDINEVIKKRKSKSEIIIFTVLRIVLYILLFYFSTLFMAGLFALLDHVRIYGIVLLLLSIVLFILFFIRLLFFNKQNIKVNKRQNFIIFISLIIFMSIGVSLSLYNYFNVEFVSDVSEKYSMNFKTLEYRFPKKGKKLYLYFNSWYKPNYIIEYDELLSGRMKIDLKYYESFYDLNVKNETGNVYLSLSPDRRDLISIYLNNLKENKIYNEKELSRYIVKIYINESDKDRLVIYD